MKKAPNIRLSLRKLLIAAMAVGPLAVLPSPVWAVLPTYNPSTNTGSFTVTNGSATVTTASNVANISTSDRAVLVWGNNTTGAPFTSDSSTITNFNIQAGETYNFVLPSSGAVLNRVKAGNTTASGNATYSGVAAYVAGSLLSSGKVFVLSDSGNIVVANGATINTQGGLILSTLNEGSDGPFTTLGDLTYNGASNGSISVGTAVVSGNLTAIGGSVAVAPTSVGGDLVLRSITSGSAITIGGTAITGNLAVTTNNANISQTGAISVGVTDGNQTANFTSGTGSISMGTAGNDFKVVNIQSTGASDVVITDANIITLGSASVNSTVGHDLTVTAGGQVNTTGIQTGGMLTIGNNASFSTTASNNSAINIGNNSSIGGTVSANTAGGAITINTTGNLTTGAISSNVSSGLGALASGLSSTITANTVGVIPVTAGGAGYTAAPTVTLSAPAAGGTQATASAVMAGGVITGITITNAGSGYTAAPTVTLSTAGETTAATLGAAVLAGGVTALNLTTPSGTGVYAGAPSVSFGDPISGGTKATGTVVYNSTTGQVTGITLTNAGSGYTANPTVTLSPGTKAAAVNGRNINITTAGALTVNGTIASSNNSSTPSVTLNGTRVEFTTTGAVNNQGTVTINSTAGDIILGTVSGNRILSTAVGGNISQVATKVLTASHTDGTSSFNAGTGNITLDNANAFNTGHTVQFTAGNVSFHNTKAFSLGTTNVTNNVTLLSDVGLTLGQGSGTGNGQSIRVGGVLTATATGANAIADNDYSSFNVFGGLNLTTGSGDITLNAANALGSLSPNVQFGQVNASTSGNVTLAETTTLNLGNITAGNLTAVSVNGGIVDSGNITINGSGSASFTASANSSVTLDGGSNVLPNISFGGGLDNSITNLNSNVTVAGSTVGTGSITVATNSGRSITLGSANVTGNLVLSSGGGIDITGNAIVSGNLSLTSTGTLNPAAVAYSTTGTQTGGVVTAISTSGLNVLSFSTAPTVVISAPPAGGTQAQATAVIDSTTGLITGFTITNAGAGYTASPTVTFTGTSVTSIAETTGTLQVSGTTNITATGDTYLGRGNDFTNVVLNGGGASGDRNVVINDVNDLSVSGETLGTVTATAGGSSSAGGPARIGNPWALTLGNLNVGGLIAAAQNGGGGNSGRITQQSGTSIHSEGLTRFTTSNNTITVTNNGNSFGRVEAFSNAGASVTIAITEDGTMKLGNLNGRGNANLTSRFGSIIEDPTADVNITNNGTLTVNAANGSVLIGNTTHTTGTTTGNLTAFSASAPNGAVAVMSLSGNANIALGNITALSLTVTSGNNVTQSGRASIFGTTNITAERGITLGNTSNNFGRVYVTTNNATTGDISITEAGTLNLGGVTMPASTTANFTATSVNGDIIDSGLGGVRPGGTIGSAGTGSVTLNATNGNIQIDDPTSDFPVSTGIVFSAKNVTLSVLGQSTLVLGAANTTSTADNLSVQSATGSITNLGNLSVTGDAAFQTGNGNITLTQTGNRFGTVRFSGRDVRITQANDINIVTGSTATGLAEFVSGSYITIENRGGIVTLGSTGNFTASGTIILPKLLQAAGTITVNSPALKDLSSLSQSADLAGRSPVNLGLGEYRAPQP